MAVYQISRIQHRRGTSGELPDALADGEIGMTTDTGEVFFGASEHPSVSGRKSYPYQNIKILTELDVQRAVTGDVYYHGPLVSGVGPNGVTTSVVPLFPGRSRDFGALDWSISSSDKNFKAMGTINFICNYANRENSVVKAVVGASTPNMGDVSWLASAFSLTSTSSDGSNDGMTWLRFANQFTTPMLVTISGREWSIPNLVGFNS